MKRSFPRYVLCAAALWISIATIGRAISPNIVISQVYGGGGNTGATYTHDYIELFNRGASTVSLTGWSVQYTSATGTGNFGSATSLITPLAGSLSPGQYLLVQEASTAAVGSPLPTPDVTDVTPINMAAAGGKVALVNTTTPLGCNGGSTPCSAGALATIVDLIGWDGANFFEGAVGPTTSNSTAALRASNGCMDTDNNGADFTAGAPNPRNTSSPLNVCAGAPTNPSGVGSANPNIVEPAGTTLLTVTVTPGTNPTSTGITVTGNLSGIGGSATQAFFDDGTNGDATAGDLVFSYQATVLFSTTAGKYTLPTSITDAEGRSGSASIALAVAEEVPIHDIQGNGSSSPHVGEFLRTSGIVTGVKSNGFFIQSKNGFEDADPDTSEGIFVFTSSAPPAAAAVGNEVTATGTVQEFIPSADPNSPPITELGGSPLVSVVSSGNTLPAPAALTAADTNPAGSIEQLEKYEGMRVTVASLTVVGPTQGSISETTATSTSIGVFYGVITGVSRPFREPGIETPDPVPNPPCCIPVFDANPERLRVDSDGQVGAAALEVTTGATVTGLVGPLDYGFRTYTILPDPGSAPGVSGNISAIPVPARASDEFTVASFNLERFFDTTDDPGISDVALTPTAFNNRLNKASLAIRNVLLAPDILGVVEVENLPTLQALASKLNADDSNLNYVAYLVEGNDIGGIDVGFLVNDNRADVVSVTQEGKDTTFINPNNGQPELLNDRPPLVLVAKITPPGGALFPVTVIANHLRSLNGVDDPVDGERVRAKRRAQAEFLANLIQTHETAGERVISVGDYNAFQFNDGYVDSIGTIKGTPTPADEVVLASSDLVTPDLTDLVDTAASSERYSYVFDGNAQVLDHILVSSDPLGRLRDFATARLDSDFPESFRNDPNRPERISDHDAPVVYLTLDPDGDGVFDDADACTASSSSATVVIDGCDSGAGNDLFSDGCKITDRIAVCAAAASTHEDFTGCVTQLTNDLKRDGFLTNKEKGDIQKCAGRADIP